MWTEGVQGFDTLPYMYIYIYMHIYNGILYIVIFHDVNDYMF